MLYMNAPERQFSEHIFLGNQRADCMMSRMSFWVNLGQNVLVCSDVLTLLIFLLNVGLAYMFTWLIVTVTKQRHHKSDAVLVKKGGEHFLFSEYLGCETKSEGILSDCDFVASSTFPFIMLLQYYILKEGLALTVTVCHWFFIL